MGALNSRWNSIDIQKLPLRSSYAILQDLQYLVDVHIGCYKLDKAGSWRAIDKKVERQVKGDPLAHRTILFGLRFILMLVNRDEFEVSTW